MSRQPHVLAVDLGTSGPKVALVGRDGSIAAAASRSVDILHVGDDGAEQDAEQIWQAVLDGATEVIRTAGVGPEAVQGIATSSQFSSIVPVDQRGKPTGPLLLWMDSRGGRYSREIYARHPEALPTWIEVHGLMPLPSGVDSLAHMLFLQHERPELFERTHKLVEPVDYLTARMTGEITANPCTVFMMMLTDNRHPERAGYDEQLIAYSGIDRSKLPELVAPNALIDKLRPEVADRLGLLPTTPVFSGTNDTQAASIAAGTFRPGHGGLNIGSTGQVLADAPEKKTDPANDLLTMPSPLAGQYMVMAENGLAAKGLDHFVRSVVFASDRLGDHACASPFDHLEEALAAAPAGSGGLLFLPWLTGIGSPSARPHVRGAFLNFSLSTGRQEMVRAIVEGVAFSLRWLLGAVEQFIGQELRTLHFSGGGARSDGWAQVLADVTDRPVLQLADAHFAGARGAAFLAFRELGLVDLGDHDTVCRVRREYTPRPENRTVYDLHFDQFLKALDANDPVFAALNR